jgi:hypothetical protein
MQAALDMAVPITSLHEELTGAPRTCLEDFVSGETVVVCVAGETYTPPGVKQPGKKVVTKVIKSQRRLDKRLASKMPPSKHLTVRIEYSERGTNRKPGTKDVPNVQPIGSQGLRIFRTWGQ